MTEAGWYKDSRDPTRARWHDGVVWTDHTIVIAEQAPGVTPAPPVTAAPTAWAPPVAEQPQFGQLSPAPSTGPAVRLSDTQVLTPLTPDQAVAIMVPLLTAGGAKVHAASSSAITGEVVTKTGASCLVAVILLLIMILPGILYLIWGGKTVVEPFSITFSVGPTGTTVTGAGQGRGEKAAIYAIGNL